MNKKLITGIVTAVLLLSLVACHKFIDIDDLWHKHNPDCRIERFTYWFNHVPDSTVGIFSYNAKGNPTSILFNRTGTGRPQFLFRYDNKGRLKDYIAPYLNDSHAYEFWYTYQHDHKGRIIGDTLYGFGLFIDNVPIPNDEFKSHAAYEYDQYDRIIKITRVYDGGTPLTIGDVYTYNAEGNRATRQRFFNGMDQGIETFGPYDNKVSIRRTNKIWMFLGEDYSKNNLTIPEKYNKSGLPVRYKLGRNGFHQFLYDTYLDDSYIEYRCK